MGPQVRPPGTILMHMYFAARLARIEPGRFVEVGCGNGQLSHILLRHGWRGLGVDLNSEAVAAASRLNRDAIEAGRYEAVHGDWFEEAVENDFDLVVSCLVLEHLDDAEEQAFYRKAGSVLRQGGRMAHFVPGSPKHWGVEDEIAGHMRRYTRGEVAARLEQAGWELHHVAGLTYPVSNLLFPLSEYLVGRHEGRLAALPMQERTVRSGHRDVPFKTRFSPVFGLALNEVTMWPFHLMQKAFSRAEAALVLYFEAKQAAGEA